MIERTNASELSQPPGYSHIVVASGSRLLSTAGAVPLDAEGNLVGEGDLLVQARKTSLVRSGEGERRFTVGVDACDGVEAACD